MTTRPGPRRWRAALATRLAPVLVALATLTGTVVALDASPAHASECDGVWVVVDPGDLGGSPTVRCAPGAPSNGVSALQGGGHEVAFVPNQPGFICAIDARPRVPCGPPPADAYWSYWHAPAGGSWTYSNVGAANRTPPVGSVEGWRFGDGSTPPRTAPPAAPSPEPEPEPGPEPEPDESEPSGDDASDAGTSDRAGRSSGSTSSDGGSTSGDTSEGGDAASADTSSSDSAATDDAPTDPPEITEESDTDQAPDRASPPTDLIDPRDIDTWDDPPADDGASGSADQDAEDEVADPDAALADEELVALRGGEPTAVNRGPLIAVGLLVVFAAVAWWQRRRVVRS